MLDTHTYSDTASTIREASEALVDILTQYKTVPILFLMSGGSSLKLLDAVPPELFDARVTMGMLDERFSSDPAVNNYLHLIETKLYKTVTMRGIPCFESVPKAGESIAEFTKRYEDYLKAWRMGHADGVIIATQGIGPDGHTAGIMPYPDDQRTFEFYFEDSDVWVVGYDAGVRNPYPLRVTVSLPFLRNIDVSIVYAVGSDKKNALDAALAPSGEVYKTPARIIRDMKHCLLYTDQPVDRVGKEA